MRDREGGRGEGQQQGEILKSDKLDKRSMPLTDRKKAKYSYLEGHPDIHVCFTPIAYETSGVVGPLSLIFLKELM